MNERILNGAGMTTRAAAHDEIARALSLPDYYGRNLDALWDFVSAMEADVILLDSRAMLDALGGYGKKLISTLQEAAQENPRFSFEIRA